MAIEPHVAQTEALVEESWRHLEALQAALAETWASIEALQLLPAEETRALAEKVSNPAVKALLLEAAEFQIRRDRYHPRRNGHPPN
jgi:hypothetical protein